MKIIFFIVSLMLVAFTSAQSGNQSYVMQCFNDSCSNEISVCKNDNLCSKVWSCLINDCIEVSTNCFGGCLSLDNQSNTAFGLFYECALPCLGIYGRL